MREDPTEELIMYVRGAVKEFYGVKLSRRIVLQMLKFYHVIHEVLHDVSRCPKCGGGISLDEIKKLTTRYKKEKTEVEELNEQ